MPAWRRNFGLLALLSPRTATDQGGQVGRSFPSSLQVLTIAMTFPILLRPVGEGLRRFPLRVQVTVAVAPMGDEIVLFAEGNAKKGLWQ